MSTNLVGMHTSTEALSWFEASLGHIVNSRPTWLTELYPTLKIKKKPGMMAHAFDLAFERNRRIFVSFNQRGLQGEF